MSSISYQGRPDALRRSTALLLVELTDEAANAARRNKPTMWAYYLQMIDALEPLEHLPELELLGRLRAISRDAVVRCPALPPVEAAHAWALGIYARRIMQRAGYSTERVSLKWLHRRTVAPTAKKGVKAA